MASDAVMDADGDDANRDGAVADSERADAEAAAARAVLEAAHARKVLVADTIARLEDERAQMRRARKGRKGAWGGADGKRKKNIDAQLAGLRADPPRLPGERVPAAPVDCGARAASAASAAGSAHHAAPVARAGRPARDADDDDHDCDKITVNFIYISRPSADRGGAKLWTGAGEFL